MNELLGKYRHFKGNYYQVLHIAKHSETEEIFVVYQALYGDREIFVRPYDMFFENVDKEKHPEAIQKERFKKVSE